MRLGIIAPGCGAAPNPSALAAAALAAEQLGYASVWVPDRRAGLDPVAALSVVAAVTRLVELGISRLVVERYDLRLLARSLRSLDTLSDGRLTVGASLGPAPDAAPATRRRRLDGLFDDWHAVCPADPGALRARPGLLIATSSARDLDHVAARADGWHAPGLAPARLAALWARVRDRAAAAGRAPETLRLVVRADLDLSERPRPAGRRPFHGAAEQVAHDVERAGRAGAEQVVLAAPVRAGFDEALDLYARVAEAAGLAPAANPGPARDRAGR